MKQDDPEIPPVLEYGRPDAKPVGHLSHKQQALIMYGIAAALFVSFLVHPQLLHVGEAIMFACIPVCLLVGNHHLRKHRNR